MKRLENSTKSVAWILTLLFSLALEGNAQLADDKCKFLGNVIAGFTPSDFTTYWNQVTPENAGKWGSVENVRDVMQWTQLDNAYNTAKNNGFPFKQHTFIWGQQSPTWIDALPPAEQLEEITEWIQAYCGRYPETAFIDVVNEPLHAAPTYMTALGGAGTTGWDWVIKSFELARTHCPNAKLILNDYNIINNDADTDNYIAIINLLKARNLIDIIGEQGHFLESTSNDQILRNLNKFHATGIPIHISEYDVNIADDNLQRDKYASQFPVLWTHPGVQGITLWGYRQGEIWRTDAYLLKSQTDGSKRPAMVWLENYIDTAPGGSFCYTTNLEKNNFNLDIYPNPATEGYVNLTNQAFGENLKVCIRTMHGAIVDTRNIENTDPVRIDLPKEPGLYMVEISNEGTKSYQKIVVQ